MAEYLERQVAMTMQVLPKRYRKFQTDNLDDAYEQGWMDALDNLKNSPAVDVEKISDGYHTFADLYEQRLILSAALAKNNPYAWKSKRHEDGSVPFGGGWFIMGFDTAEGCYTYHYELKDWDLFQCKELDRGKPWDGHTSKDVRRLLSIPSDDVAPVRHGRWKYNTDFQVWNCSECGENPHKGTGVVVVEKNLPAYCPHCGVRMDGRRLEGKENETEELG